MIVKEIWRYTLQFCIWMWMGYDESEWDMTIHITNFNLNVNGISRVMTYYDTHYKFIFDCEWDMKRENEIDDTHYNFIFECEWHMTSDVIWRHTLEIYIRMWMRYDESDEI